MVRLISGETPTPRRRFVGGSEGENPRPQAKKIETPTALAFRAKSGPPNAVGVSTNYASTSQKQALETPTNRRHPVGVSPHLPLEELADCLRARKRFTAQLDSRVGQLATQRLEDEYLPSIETLYATTTTAALEAEAERLAGRLERGVDYDGSGAERWFSILDRYEVVLDCRNLEYVGTVNHPSSYLRQRIVTRCRS